MRTKKIFVGGLSATTSLEDVKAYFEQFSEVRDAMVAYDRVTNRHRGFGFVTFYNDMVVDKICEIRFHEINGTMVESKKAVPKGLRSWTGRTIEARKRADKVKERGDRTSERCESCGFLCAPDTSSACVVSTPCPAAEGSVVYCGIVCRENDAERHATKHHVSECKGCCPGSGKIQTNERTKRDKKDGNNNDDDKTAAAAGDQLSTAASKAASFRGVYLYPDLTHAIEGTFLETFLADGRLQSGEKDKIKADERGDEDGEIKRARESVGADADGGEDADTDSNGDVDTDGGKDVGAERDAERGGAEMLVWPLVWLLIINLYVCRKS